MVKTELMCTKNTVRSDINLLFVKELLKLLRCHNCTERYHFIVHCFIECHKLHNLPGSRELTVNDASLSRFMSFFKIRIFKSNNISKEPLGM